MNLPKAVLAFLTMVLLPSAFAQGLGGGTDSTAVALKGYDVVAYFSDRRPTKGSPAFQQDFDGARYYFSNSRNLASFSADPDRFAPQFGGYCAMGVSQGKKFEADPTIFRIVDGKLYVFSKSMAGDAADRDPDLLARAHHAWEALK
jgi:YHS domain-containing protein